MTYDEALDTNSAPAPSAFGVTVNGSARNVSGVAIGGSAVTLTLASAVTAGQVVTLDYIAPGTNPIQDEAGNNAAGFTNQPVINALTPAVTVTRRTGAMAQAETATEGATLGFTIAASPSPAADLPVNYRISGGAAFGIADATATGSVATDGDLDVSYATTNDVLDEEDSDFTVTVLAGTGYRVATPSSATVTVEDDDALPVAPTITSIGAFARQLRLYWDAPADPGYSDGTDEIHTDNTVTAYDVRYILSGADDKSDGQWTVVDDAWTMGILEYPIASLTAGESYDVQLRAVTRAGEGPWSATSLGTPNQDTFPPNLRFDPPPTVNGAVLTLTYDEPLDPASVPAAGDFEVTVDGSRRPWRT